MGKKKGNKKKGAGAEKTAQKTVQKGKKKVQKETGEDDIDSILADLRVQDHARTVTTVEVTPPPAARSSATFVAHPSKDELILFGGIAHTLAQRDHIFDDNGLRASHHYIAKKEWRKITSPNPPPARSAHQCAVVERGGGQMWVFGGEFMSPTGSQFKTYKDLWVLHLSGPQSSAGGDDNDGLDAPLSDDDHSDDSDADKPKKKPAKKETKAPAKAPAAASASQPVWEEVKLKNGPPARSGHRMIVHKRRLLVFGGFHDNGLGDMKYYSDLWSLDLESMVWTKHETPAAQPAPSARSGFNFFVHGDVAFLYGGYRTDKVKGDGEKGVVMNDMWQLDLNTMAWTNIKNSGTQPSLRSGCTMAVVKKRAYLYGGVTDNDHDEDLESTFYNDMYYFSLASKRWAAFVPGTKGSGGDGDDDGAEKKKKNTKKEEKAKAAAATANAIAAATGTVVPKAAAAAPTPAATPATIAAAPATPAAVETFMPPARRSPLIAVKGNTLYLYGGMVEEKEKEITFNDFYSLDCASDTATWQTLVAAEAKWVGEADEDDDDDEEEEKDEKKKGKAGKGEKKDGKAAAGEEKKKAPEVIKPDEPTAAEVLADFFKRTNAHWTAAVRKDKPDAADKEVRRLAFELASAQFEKVNKARKDAEADEEGDDNDEDGEGDDDEDDDDEDEDDEDDDEEEEETPPPSKKSQPKKGAAPKAPEPKKGKK